MPIAALLVLVWGRSIDVWLRCRPEIVVIQNRVEATEPTLHAAHQRSVSVIWPIASHNQLQHASPTCWQHGEPSGWLTHARLTTPACCRKTHTGFLLDRPPNLVHCLGRELLWKRVHAHSITTTKTKSKKRGCVRGRPSLRVPSQRRFLAALAASALVDPVAHRQAAWRVCRGGVCKVPHTHGGTLHLAWGPTGRWWSLLSSARTHTHGGTLLGAHWSVVAPRRGPSWCERISCAGQWPMAATPARASAWKMGGRPRHVDAHAQNR